MELVGGLSVDTLDPHKGTWVDHLRIFLQMKNPPKISLLITKLSISQTYIC
jgi:hypothetical protein